MPFESLISIAQSFTQLPAFLKAIGFFLVWLGVWLPVAMPLAIGLKWQPGKPFTIPQKLAFVLSLYAFAPPLVWLVARVEGGSLADYGLRFNPNFLISLAIGLGLGMVGVAILFGLETLFGWIDRQQATWKAALIAFLPTLLLGLLISLVEELVFRGLLLNWFQQDYAAGWAAIVTSAIFAVLHLVWDGKDARPQLPGLWLMGMVLVVARWVDGGSLAIACGLHTGWILGMTLLDTAEALRYTDRAPVWLVGIDGKPLAGGMGLLLLLGTAAVLQVI